MEFLTTKTVPFWTRFNKEHYKKVIDYRNSLKIEKIKREILVFICAKEKHPKGSMLYKVITGEIKRLQGELEKLKR